MSLVVGRSALSAVVAGEPSRDEQAVEASEMGRACLACAFLVVILCSILKTSGAQPSWMGGMLGLSAGLVSAFLFLGWQQFTTDVARHMRRASSRR
jgi:hypothetical protein